MFYTFSYPFLPARINKDTNDITLQKTVNSNQNLTVNASGTTRFNDAVNVNNLTTDAAGNTQINGSVTTTGTQTYNDSVEIQNPVTLSTANSDITFANKVDSQNGEANNLTLSSGTGNISFNDSVGESNGLGNVSVNSGGTTRFNNTLKATSLTTDLVGTTNINGNITTSGDQTFGHAVNLQADATRANASKKYEQKKSSYRGKSEGK